MPNRIIVTLSFIFTLCFSLVLNTNELFAHSPKKKDVLSLKEIKKQIHIPLVADIHFHYQLALESLKSGVDCLRLNPGNIRDREKVELVVNEAKSRNIPIRIGVNFGSLPPINGIGQTKGLSRHNDGVNNLPSDTPEDE